MLGDVNCIQLDLRRDSRPQFRFPFGVRLDRGIQVHSYIFHGLHEGPFTKNLSHPEPKRK